MVALSLKICVRQCNVVKTMQFEPSTPVYDACRIIRERVPETQSGQASDYGLFLSDEDPRKGIWLESGRTLDYYMLRNGDVLEYKKKQRPQKIKMLDGTIKTIMVDDSKTVGELLVTICSRIGITNYEEYSLIQEVTDDKKEDSTGTLKKDRTLLLRDERKMEKLKAKLHTDDDLNWLDHSRTFREQGVEESETLLLRRKFFYSDQNVDSRDPVQLNLLYVQARDDILNGSHPVSFDKACEFAGIQAQIQFGPHVEHKHKPGFLDLKEFLPKEYIKQRGSEKKIFQDHKNCGEMTEIEAKVKYVKLARSLPTYGVSFFLVKEKMKGKNKLVPRLLGITKESVMRVDEKTKDVVQEWPLTTVKRWAASPKSFTLDFGEYQESYYSVQTTEGEQISQLIAGYIDIILKKKQSKDRFGLEGDEESTMLEESVSPKKSTILQQQFNRVGRVEHGSVALPGIMRSGSVGGPDTFNMGTMPSAQQQITTGQMHRGHMPPLSLAQQALMGTINSSMKAVQQAQSDLGHVDNLPPLGHDLASRVWVQNKVDESKHEIHSQVDAITAGTASVVNLTAGEPTETDYTAVGCAITTISSNLTEMSKGVKLLAALMDDEVGSGHKLMGAARMLAGAVSDLLRSVEPAAAEPRQTVLTAAGSIGQASGDLLRHMGEGETDEKFQDTLMNLAKAVANAAAMLVLKAKNVAQVSEDTVLQNRVIAAATQCALSTSQLVACTKVVSPTISSPVCQEQLVEAGKLVDRSVETCVKACRSASDDGELLKQVATAAGVVSQTLSDLLQHVRHYASCGEPIGRYDQATDTIMNVTENIFSSMGDAGEMVRQARVLAQATSDLVNAMRSDAEAEVDVDNSKKLLAAAKLLADATARMVEAAKGAAAYPENEDQQQRLREAAEGLRVATNAAAQNAIKKKLVIRLEIAAKQAAAAATQTIAAAQNAAASNKNTASHQQLVHSCKAVADNIPQLVQGMRSSLAQPEELGPQLALIMASQSFLQPGSKMVTSAKSAVPTVADQAAAMQLGQCAKNLATCLAELRTATQKAHEACGPLEIDSALKTVQTLKSELQDAKMDKAPGQRECDYSIDNINKCIRNIEQASLASVGQTLPCRDDISMEAIQEQLTSSVQEIGHLIDPVSTAARGEAAQLGHKVTQLASYFDPLVVASVGLASKLNDHQQQMTILDQTKTLSESALQMLYAAKEGGGNPKACHTHDAISEAAQLMKEAVDDIMVTLNEAASEGGMVGGMMESIAESIGRLDEGTPPEPEGSFVDYQTTMVKFSKAIAITAQEMMTKSVTCPEELGGLASQVTVDYGQLAHQGHLAAATAEPEEVAFQIKTRVQELGHGCIYLVQKAGALQLSPTDSFSKRELIECARAVTEKVSLVLSALQAGNKGTQACITAASAVSGIIADLDTTIMFASAGTLNSENEESFADHRESILKTAKALVEDTKLLVAGAASSQEKLAQAAHSSAKTITQLTEVVKLGATSMGSDDPETQVVLINAVRDVAKALAELIGATKCAAGKAADDPSMYQLKSAAKVMVTNVTSLLKTVKAVEDEATRGTRALEATIEFIKQELTVFQSKDVPDKSTSPEEFIRKTKSITIATAKAVAAGNSAQQEDVIATANLSRKAISDMLTTCKQAAHHPEVSEELKSKALQYSSECATKYISLLEEVLQVLQRSAPEQKQQLAVHSKHVAACVTELVQTAEAMKDGGSECVDPEDPNFVAETELLGAAASIEAAAKKLEQLKPRAKPKQADETLDFEEQILEAAKSIAAATSALVKSASAAQRELVAQGKVGSNVANAVDDGQWSQGLISAARMVAAATSNLCEAANASVQGHASEEKLISSAKQVAASTAQLLVACKVKADHNSEAMRRLQAAGNAVKRASDNLVKAAQKAAFDKTEDDSVLVKTRFVGGIAQIIAAQEEMLRKERELEDARKKLAQIRQQQYKFLPSELREDEG
ncbi:talin-2 [Nematolebias whitei]|uniref:talin-2 n=1 Tax=Nematolebias whitei TaxID=451745 RepID=UPI00189928C6|nr:talin-2 [Nematolebias whitei]